MTTMPPDPQDPMGGAPPPPPPPGYGTPPPPPGYGAPGGGMPAPPGQWAGPPLASWGERAVANLIDYSGPVIVAVIIQNAVSSALGTLLTLAALAWGIYNAYLQGQTGQSTGKKQGGLRLLREDDGQVIGGGAGIGRFFLHIIDALPCYLGFLWPLWDAKKQTFADKIMRTVVVKG
jgi:uncharacterized RDD family membrane protein YckC